MSNFFVPRISRNILKNMSKNVIGSGSRFFYIIWKPYFYQVVSNGGQNIWPNQMLAIPLTLSHTNSNFLENSRHEELQPQICKNLCVVVDTARFNFLQKSWLSPYYDAFLKHILKSFIYSLPGMADFETYERGRIVHTNRETIKW